VPGFWNGVEGKVRREPAVRRQGPGEVTQSRNKVRRLPGKPDSACEELVPFAVAVEQLLNDDFIHGVALSR
jgi:hypothetical protein